MKKTLIVLALAALLLALFLAACNYSRSCTWAWTCTHPDNHVQLYTETGDGTSCTGAQQPAGAGWKCQCLVTCVETYDPAQMW